MSNFLRVRSAPRGLCAWLLLWAALGHGSGTSTGRALAQDTSDKTVAPVYEGFQRNPDGSFDLLFGYFNRNWDEDIDAPVGPDNRIEPGGPDQGQPAHFLPRRNRFVFRVRVPANFGDKEIVWTLTTRGQTLRAYGTLKPLYEVDDVTIAANFGGGGWHRLPPRYRREQSALARGGRRKKQSGPRGRGSHPACRRQR